jgi:hypothetical protein
VVLYDREIAVLHELVGDSEACAPHGLERGFARDGLYEELVESLDSAGLKREDDCFLAWKVAEEGTSRHGGAFGDVVDGHGVKTVAREQIEGRSNQRFSGLRLLALSEPGLGWN